MDKNNIVFFYKINKTITEYNLINYINKRLNYLNFNLNIINFI